MSLRHIAFRDGSASSSAQIAFTISNCEAGVTDAATALPSFFNGMNRTSCTSSFRAKRKYSGISETFSRQQTMHIVVATPFSTRRRIVVVAFWNVPRPRMASLVSVGPPSSDTWNLQSGFNQTGEQALGQDGSIGRNVAAKMVTFSPLPNPNDTCWMQKGFPTEQAQRGMGTETWPKFIKKTQSPIHIQFRSVPQFLRNVTCAAVKIAGRDQINGDILQQGREAGFWNPAGKPRFFHSSDLGSNAPFVVLPRAVLTQDSFERRWFFQSLEKLPKFFINHMPVALRSPNLQDETILLLDVIWRSDMEEPP